MSNAGQIETVANALHRVRLELEQERRAQFSWFGIEQTCLWPCSQLFHSHSSLGPAWVPVLTIAEVELLTHNMEYREYPSAARTALPPTDALLGGLEQAIRSRRTSLGFSHGPLSLKETAKLLELGSGVTAETAEGQVPKRAAPSGGALYPVETYVIALSIDDLPLGVYHYSPTGHCLEHLRVIETTEELRTFLPPRLYEAQPALLIAFTAVFARTQMKYLERGYRFALLETGHIAQNVLLAATAMQLATVPLGGFWDEPFNEFLGLDPTTEAVLYGILVGRPMNPYDARR